MTAQPDSLHRGRADVGKTAADARTTAPRDDAPIVLHVSEAYGGGVMNVIHDYIAATPEYRHYILCSPRPGVDTGSGVTLVHGEVIDWPRSPHAALATIKRVMREIRPDIVHAHSSIAGAWVRLSRAVPTRKIYYTPHCFAFERHDVGSLTRFAFRAVERVLARRTAHFVAVSPRELKLARSLHRRAVGTYVPNVATLPEFTPSQSSETITVATIGRVTAQKAPEYFTDVVHAAESPGAPHVEWVWLGDGAGDLVHDLEEAGVRVSGWLPRDEVLSRLTNANVYLHTASWEGSPLSILEAAELGLPVVARRTPAVESLGLPNLVGSPQEAADAIRQACRPGAEAPDYAEFLSRHTASTQSMTLRGAYESSAPLPAGPATTGQCPDTTSARVA